MNVLSWVKQKYLLSNKIHTWIHFYSFVLTDILINSLLKLYYYVNKTFEVNQIEKIHSANFLFIDWLAIFMCVWSLSRTSGSWNISVRQRPTENIFCTCFSKKFITVKEILKARGLWKLLLRFRQITSWKNVGGISVSLIANCKIYFFLD